ncbi:MAG: IS1595 family transposase [Desulfobulbaceae bacterium]|nr:MAG: IS1595 family transposase [Desulfobulbaceae bacterium]
MGRENYQVYVAGLGGVGDHFRRIAAQHMSAGGNALAPQCFCLRLDEFLGVLIFHFQKFGRSRGEHASRGFGPSGKRGIMGNYSGKMPLVAALSLSDKKHPLYLKLSHFSGFTLNEISAWSAKHLRPESHVISDVLNCFPAVTQNQCQHEPIVTSVGGKYADRKVFQWLNTVIGNVKNSMHGTHHAISSRHLPRYLAEFCYRFNRRFQLHTMVDRLTYVALRT